ncbi:hypothetical protein ACFQZU_23010, partial [Streptomonospora algeriensis]
MSMVVVPAIMAFAAAMVLLATRPAVAPVPLVTAALAAFITATVLALLAPAVPLLRPLVPALLVLRPVLPFVAVLCGPPLRRAVLRGQIQQRGPCLVEADVSLLRRVDPDPCTRLTHLLPDALRRLVDARPGGTALHQRVR